MACPRPCNAKITMKMTTPRTLVRTLVTTVHHVQLARDVQSPASPTLAAFVWLRPCRALLLRVLLYQSDEGGKRQGSMLGEACIEPKKELEADAVSSWREPFFGSI